MVKAITNIEGGSVSEEIGDPESSRQDEVEPAGLFRDLSCQIGPKGAAGEFGIGPDSIQPDERIFDFRGEAEAVRKKRFLKLDIDHLGPDRDLPAIPPAVSRISDGHHPRGHEGRTLLLGCVVLRETMGEHVAGSESDFLRSNRDRGRAVRGTHTGRCHERPKSQYCEDPDKKRHATIQVDIL